MVIIVINLTTTQKKELKNLNQRLLELQKKILNEAVKIDSELIKRVKNKADHLER